MGEDKFLDYVYGYRYENIVVFDMVFEVDIDVGVI